MALWPEVYPYQKLMEIRLAEGDTAFSAEYQNDPLDPEQCLFARAKISYWDDHYASTEDRLPTRQCATPASPSRRGPSPVAARAARGH